MYKWFIILFCIAVTSEASQLKLTVESSLAPAIKPFFDIWFQDAGVSYVFEPCSAARCIKLLETDITVNGDAARRFEFEKKITRLTPVGRSYAGVSVYAMSLNFRKWPPSSMDIVACVRGIYSCEKKVNQKNIIWTNTVKQAEKMLLRHRVEWVVMAIPSFYPPPTGSWIYIDTVGGFLFIDVRMTDEIMRLEQSQNRLIKSGTWQDMQRKFLRYVHLNIDVKR
ncbi:hypothetical protein [Aeromonas sp. SG16]|uniref:hypothetical protein n=1 Tax=Aeromonas sp. SG16 TaxID=2950548 RepID=UPI00210C45FE|nr:hypothetical protein [Aeromonas sp. SG16]MCQ4054456.1 hypothetical protein [Aeromonas sp. SG16]